MKILKKIIVQIISFCYRTVKELKFKDRLSPIDLYMEKQVRDSFEEFSDEMEKAMIFPNRSAMREFAMREFIKLNKANDNKLLILEFGVASGNSINHFAKILERNKLEVLIHGFDSFLGIQEDWIGMEKGRPTGSYSLKGVIPNLESNVVVHKGLVQDTLPLFLDQNKNAVGFAHLDMDTYTPGRFTLEKLKPRFKSGSLILFDDF